MSLALVNSMLAVNPQSNNIKWSMLTETNRSKLIILNIKKLLNVISG